MPVDYLVVLQKMIDSGQVLVCSACGALWVRGLCACVKCPECGTPAPWQQMVGAA